MLAQFLNSPTGALVYLVLLAAFADLAVGVWAAVKSGTFEWDAVAAFLRVHILGRVAPIFGLLALGWAVGLVPIPEGLAQVAPALFSGAGMLSAGLYVAETLGSVLASLRAAGAKAQPVPAE